MSMPLVAILAALVAGLGGWAAAGIMGARRRESELQDWTQRLATQTAQLESARELLQEARHKEGKLAEAQQQAAAYWSAMQEHSKQLEDMRQQRGKQAERLEQLSAELTRLTAREQELATLLEQERGQNAEKLALLTEARESMAGQFKALAGDILEEKAKRFTEQNQQNLGHLLGPLQQRLQDFGKLVQDSYEKDSQGRLSLEAELKRLQELNSRLGDDAIALTRALTGASSKAQGSWGEMVLERVLETSGLHKDREYRVQVSDVVAGEDGNRRYQPDVVIDLPEGKQLVVDSKVSLNAYVRYTAAEDEAERAAEMKAHVAAIRNHIRTLSEKRYQDLYRLNTLDFVFMFIPVEPAYLLAVQQDMSLFNEAFERRIMIVGPSTLLATLRTVASIWRYEYQNQNAQEIARQGGAMYDKFVGFAANLEKLGKQLDVARDSFGDAMKQLSSGRGNLVASAERLRKLGVRNNKQLQQHLKLGAAEDEGAEGAEEPGPD
ncbi:DNA recombination protein RmuC [Chromobacterium sp. Panama]|uniref:DNA recombination protein RmuC n=1 Tax=Chromobacterium sp. Panama TaxID=2161826 RepID=UPI001E4C83B3|nr:DNA recombination protein RmuC [Chromobacterium sp. Panama]